MKVVVIDNIDSFVYNLVQYIGELGADPVVFTKRVSLEEIKNARPDKIVLSPGPKRPEDAGVTVDVIKRIGKKVPVLGVCLGHQAIGYAFGGKIVQAKQIMHGKTSEIEHYGNPLFESVPKKFEAVRYHSLVVDRESLPDCFNVTAETTDNHREIMGLKHKKYPIFGIQFHPESILTRNGKQIVKNFLEMEATE